MPVASKSKTASLKGQFAKHLVVVNPKISNELLGEVLLASFNSTFCLLIFDIQY
jgi:hypothetical protein